jgi:hypothetical protein
VKNFLHVMQLATSVLKTVLKCVATAVVLRTHVASCLELEPKKTIATAQQTLFHASNA